MDGILEGGFRNHWAYLPLTLRGDAGEAEIDFLVDTGFSGPLALPEEILRRLGAVLIRREPYRLADGSIADFALYDVGIGDDDDEQFYIALAKEGNPLVGLEFFREMHLHIEVTEGGSVFAEAL